MKALIFTLSVLLAPLALKAEENLESLYRRIAPNYKIAPGVSDIRELNDREEKLKEEIRNIKREKQDSKLNDFRRAEMIKYLGTEKGIILPNDYGFDKKSGPQVTPTLPSVAHPASEASQSANMPPLTPPQPLAPTQPNSVASTQPKAAALVPSRPAAVTHEKSGTKGLAPKEETSATKEDFFHKYLDVLAKDADIKKEMIGIERKYRERNKQSVYDLENQAEIKKALEARIMTFMANNVPGDGKIRNPEDKKRVHQLVDEMYAKLNPNVLKTKEKPKPALSLAAVSEAKQDDKAKEEIPTLKNGPTKVQREPISPPTQTEATAQGDAPTTDQPKMIAQSLDPVKEIIAQASQPQSGEQTPKEDSPQGSDETASPTSEPTPAPIVVTSDQPQCDMAIAQKVFKTSNEEELKKALAVQYRDTKRIEMDKSDKDLNRRLVVFGYLLRNHNIYLEEPSKKTGVLANLVECIKEAGHRSEEAELNEDKKRPTYKLHTPGATALKGAS